jgi:hypothetical protein
MPAMDFQIRSWTLIAAALAGLRAEIRTEM